MFKPTDPKSITDLPGFVVRVFDRQRRLRAAGIVVVAGVLAGFAVGGGVQQYQNCSRGNDYRANDLKGWVKLADTLDPNRGDPRTEKFLAFQRAKDAQRNCSPL